VRVASEPLPSQSIAFLPIFPPSDLCITHNASADLASAFLGPILAVAHPAVAAYVLLDPLAHEALAHRDGV